MKKLMNVIELRVWHKEVGQNFFPVDKTWEPTS